MNGFIIFGGIWRSKRIFQKIWDKERADAPSFDNLCVVKTDKYRAQFENCHGWLRFELKMVDEAGRLQDIFENTGPSKAEHIFVSEARVLEHTQSFLAEYEKDGNLYLKPKVSNVVPEEVISLTPSTAKKKKKAKTIEEDEDTSYMYEKKLGK